MLTGRPMPAEIPDGESRELDYDFRLVVPWPADDDRLVGQATHVCCSAMVFSRDIMSPCFWISLPGHACAV